MSEPDEKTVVVNRPRRAWYSRDIWLFAGLLLSYGGFLAVRHIIAHLSGLQRVPPLWFALVLLVLAVLTVVLLVGLALRMGRAWRRHIQDRRQLVGWWLLAVLAIMTYLVLPFTRFGWPPYKTFTRAFRKYTLANVDLDAMRAWLNTLNGKYDPNYTYDLESGATIEDWWPEAGSWAKAITPLGPVSAELSPDGNGHPAVRIRWVGLLNSWGLVVGSKDMQTPPSDFPRYSEYRVPLDSGAYVWHERGGLWRLLRFLTME
jgi:hypothetical protein